MADHFGRTFTLGDQTPQPHNHPLGPTLDELIAEYEKRQGHWNVIATYLRELRQLREGVARVREIVSREVPLNWAEDAAHENGCYLGLCTVCRAAFTGHKRRVICKRCDTLRALTPEGTT